MTTPLLAQNSPTQSYIEEEQTTNQFDRESWQKATSGIDFSEALDHKKAAKKQAEERTKDRNTFSFKGGLSTAFAIILLTIFGGILLFFIIRFTLNSGQFTRNKKINSQNQAFSLEEIEEDLEAKDPTRLIEQAIQSGDFRLALRLYYLKVIRELSLTGAVRWKKDKTNGDYVRELKSVALRPSFKSLTYTFDKIWYGNQVLEQEEFTALQSEFEDLLNKIPQYENK